MSEAVGPNVDDTGWQEARVRDLPALRHRVRAMLSRYDDKLVTDAQLLVNELATLALADPSRPVRLRLSHAPDRRLRVELDHPAMLVPARTPEQRCGIELVRALAAVSGLDGGTGHTVRADFDLTAPSHRPVFPAQARAARAAS
ncbi:ATP-binding protein [Prauserella flavalba]|uniref:hypothetical protein n=1 Tax=Prauserella flavalba TaxID=1477506 RepID=UPI0036ED8181